MNTALTILAAWVGTSVFFGGGYFALLYAVRTLRNPRNQSTRESEPTGFLGVGGAADSFVSHDVGDTRG